MKKNLIFLLTIILFFSFANLQAKSKKKKMPRYINVKIVLEKVHRKPYLIVDSHLMKEHLFEDDIMKIVWSPEEKQFAFKLLNKTEETIEILWDKVIFIDSEGEGHRTIHVGVKYNNRNEYQTPTIIPMLTRIRDGITPAENVSFKKGKWGGWKTNRIFKKRLSTREVKKKQKENPDYSINDFIDYYKYRIAMTLKIEDVEFNYNFFFKTEILERK